VLVNLVASAREAQEVFRQLDIVTGRFLDIRIDYLGCVLRDDNLTRGVKHQRLVSDLYPDSKASRCFSELAKRMSKLSPASRPKGNTNLFWHHLVRTTPL
jgi:flagellar biosynthesis protein FlhG